MERVRTGLHAGMMLDRNLRRILHSMYVRTYLNCVGPDDGIIRVLTFSLVDSIRSGSQGESLWYRPCDLNETCPVLISSSLWSFIILSKVV